MKILITGVSSALGQNLASRLGTAGGSVRGLVHRSHVEPKGWEAVSGDVTRPETLKPAVEGMEAVVHLAALTRAWNPADYFRVNVEGTKNLVRVCREQGVQRLVHVSSGAAEPGAGAYGESKRESEAVVRDSGLPWVLLRPREVYGPGTGESLQALFRWVRLFPWVPVIGDGTCTLSPVFLDDVVSAMAASVMRPDVTGRTFVLAGPEVLTWNDLVDRVAAFLGVRRRTLHLPVGSIHGAVRALAPFKKGFLVPDQIPRLLCAKSSDIEPARTFLDFHPRSLEEGLRQSRIV